MLADAALRPAPTETAPLIDALAEIKTSTYKNIERSTHASLTERALARDGDRRSTDGAAVEMNASQRTGVADRERAKNVEIVGSGDVLGGGSI